jgi:hypothetical protein
MLKTNGMYLGVHTYLSNTVTLTAVSVTGDGSLATFTCPTIDAGTIFNGEFVQISGASDPAYNGNFTAIVTNYSNLALVYYVMTLTPQTTTPSGTIVVTYGSFPPYLPLAVAYTNAYRFAQAGIRQFWIDTPQDANIVVQAALGAQDGYASKYPNLDLPMEIYSDGIPEQNNSWSSDTANELYILTGNDSGGVATPYARQHQIIQLFNFPGDKGPGFLFYAGPLGLPWISGGSGWWNTNYARTDMGVMCMAPSSLMLQSDQWPDPISNVITTLPGFNYFTNAEAIRIDQDIFMSPGRVMDTNNVSVYGTNVASQVCIYRALANGDMAVGFWNLNTNTAAYFSLAFTNIPGLRLATVAVEDVFAGTTNTSSGPLAATVNAGGFNLYRIGNITASGSLDANAIANRNGAGTNLTLYPVSDNDSAALNVNGSEGDLLWRWTPNGLLGYDGDTVAITISPVGDITTVGDVISRGGVSLSNGVVKAQSSVIQGTMTASNVWDKSNVKYWGAKGDTNADDTAAIQVCIDNAYTGHVFDGIQGASVYLPAGGYKLTSPLILKPGVRFYGDSRYSTQLYSYVTNGDALYFPADLYSDPLFYLANVNIENLSINQRVNSAYSAIHFTGTNITSQPIIKNVAIIQSGFNSAYGIRLRQTINAVIESTKIIGTTTAGYMLESPNNISSLFANYASYCSGDAYNIQADQINMDSNGADSCGGVGYRLNHTTALNFSSNEAELNTGGSIYLSNGASVIISSGYFVSSETNSVTVDGGSDISINNAAIANEWGLPTGYALVITNFPRLLNITGGSYDSVGEGVIDNSDQIATMIGDPLTGSGKIKAQGSRPVILDPVTGNVSIRGMANSGWSHGFLLTDNLGTANTAGGFTAIGSAGSGPQVYSIGIPGTNAVTMDGSGNTLIPGYIRANGYIGSTGMRPVTLDPAVGLVRINGATNSGWANGVLLFDSIGTADTAGGFTAYGGAGQPPQTYYIGIPQAATAVAVQSNGNTFIPGTLGVGSGAAGPSNTFQIGSGANAGGSIVMQAEVNPAYTAAYRSTDSGFIFGTGQDSGNAYIRSLDIGITAIPSMAQGGGQLRFWTTPWGAYTGEATNALERMIIDKDGNVGIGTNAPGMKLDVSGNVQAASYYGDGSHLTGVGGGDSTNGLAGTNYVNTATNDAYTSAKSFANGLTNGTVRAAAAPGTNAVATAIGLVTYDILGNFQFSSGSFLTNLLGTTLNAAQLVGSFPGNSDTATTAANFVGQLSPTNFASGSGASSSTYLSGAGTWTTPAGGAGGTNSARIALAFASDGYSTNVAAYALVCPVGVETNSWQRAVYMTLSLTTNALIAAPSGAVDKQTLEIVLSQDATGGRVVYWDTGFEFCTDIPKVVVTGYELANKHDVVRFQYSSSSTKWEIRGLLQGYAN